MDFTIEKEAPPLPSVENGDRRKPSIKLISCFIRPEKLDDVTNALNRLNLVGGMTVVDVRGFGRQKGSVEHYRGGKIIIRFIDKIKLELAVSSDDAEEVIQTIKENAQTGSVGDGKIFVVDVHNALRIRTGERGISAL